MKRTIGRRLGGTSAILLCVIALGIWQWQALIGFGITAVAGIAAHVDLSLGRMRLSHDRVEFAGTRITSFRGEPIASIGRLSIEYDAHDLLTGKRLFGLKSVDADGVHITIVRRADGTYNVAVPHLSSSAHNAGAPLNLSARLEDGSIEVIDRSAAAASGPHHMYVENLNAQAEFSPTSVSRYSVALAYGQHRARLYPVTGTGTIDPRHGYIDQRWTAAALPIAAALNFALDTRSVRVQSGDLRNVDAQYVGLADATGTLAPRVSARADLQGLRVSIAGLQRPIDDVHGPIELYDGGLVTPRLDAVFAGVRVRAGGALYDITDPKVRLTARGSGDLAQLRPAFAQAQRLLMSGPFDFAMLIEGKATAPLTWIALHSPRATYTVASVDALRAVVAFDGREADVVNFITRYKGIDVYARGRADLHEAPNAVEMLAGIHAGALPYAQAVLPGLAIDGVALATATNPQQIALRGLLSGTGPNENIAGIFDVDERGTGSIGPLLLQSGRGTLYARAAIDRPHDDAWALVETRAFPVPAVRGQVNATAFAAQTHGTTAIDGIADLRGAWGSLRARTQVGTKRGTVAGSITGTLKTRQHGDASFAGMLGGTTASPSLVGTAVVAGGRYRNFNVNGNAGIAFSNDRLELRDAMVAIGPLFLGVAGTIRGLAPGKPLVPRYDLAAELHSSDVGELATVLQPRAAGFVQGSVDASVRVAGTGMHPSFAGTMSAPEGSVNGLAFRDLHASVAGDAGAVGVRGGRVLVGSTAIGFDAAVTPASVTVDASMPRTDLADFNDFFDAGDMFAGTGSISLRAMLHGMQLASSSGRVRLSQAHVRRVALGNVAADWQSAGQSIVGRLAFGGVSGDLRVSGSVAPAAMTADLHASAHHLDLGTWLPMLGFAVPATGRLNAESTLSGRYPDVALSLRAALADGTLGRFPIERFDLALSAVHGRGTVQSAVLDIPSLTTVGSGTFGLGPHDRLALAIRSTSENIAPLLREATGQRYDLSGSLDSTLHVVGTRAEPSLIEDVTLQSIHYGNITIPRIAGEIGADWQRLTLRNGEIDLQRGRALVAAAAPIRFAPPHAALGTGPISASLTADDVDLTDLLPLLPKGTQLSGRIDGTVTLSGTAAAPRLNGTIAMHDGTFGGPMERSPITGVQSTLAFGGMGAALQGHAFIGPGALTFTGVAPEINLRHPLDSALRLQATADNARLDMPAYFQGTLDGTLAVRRDPDAPIQLGGTIAVSSARVPLDAFLNQKPRAGGESALPTVAFNGLHVSAGRDVRVQSRNVDIGATGAITIDGTLDAPTLAGSFRSTGGSLSFYRTFNVQRGVVQFDPSGGVVPDVDAVATTFVSDPPTEVRLQVTGPATEMNLGLASDPAYDRQQILGLLVGAQQFGAVAGVQSSSQRTSAGSAVQGLALGQLDTDFTRTMLEPLSTALGSSLGFADLQITSDIQTGLGVNAVKAFGRNVNASFAQSFGYPRTQSVALEARSSVATAYRLTAYSAEGPTLFALQQPQPIGMDVLMLSPITAVQPESGSGGVDFSFERKFP